MKVEVRIPRVLEKYAHGRSAITLEGNRVCGLLSDLHRLYPQLYISICDETGKLRKHVHLFINDVLWTEDSVHDELSDDDIVSVFQAVSGG